MDMTNGLRFVERDGKRILQQRWVQRGPHHDEFHWFDVLMMEETKDGYCGPYPLSSRDQK